MKVKIAVGGSLCALVLFLDASAALGSLLPVHLCCEYATKALGIGERQPRLSWEFDTDNPTVRGQRQTAYRVLVASTIEQLQNDQADLWDSGKVESDNTVGVEYGGRALQSSDRCYWKVQVWDQDSKPSSWSEITFWTVGLLAPQDWQAQWIGVPSTAVDASRFFRDWTRRVPGPADPVPRRVPAGPEVQAWIEAAKTRVTLDMPKQINGLTWSEDRLEELQPAALLRREFTVAAPVKRATVYLCGLGCYELWLNGKRVQGRVLDPAETNYGHYAYYVTYDVTKAMRVGKNALGVVLGDGFYRQAVAFAAPKTPAIFGQRGLILQLEIELGDGRRERVVSDGRWKCSVDGPLLKNSVFSGELYDARREMPGWDCAGFDDRSWSAVEIIPPLAPRLEPQMIPPIRVVETVKPVAISNPRPGVWVYDFGCHLTGFVRLRVAAAAGTEITLKYVETLARDGTAFQPEAFLGAKSVDIYVCRGGQEESWEPDFTEHSFRHVQMEGFPDKPTLDMLEGRFVTTEMEPAMQFECANSMFNRLHAAFVRTGMENTQGNLCIEPLREKTSWMTYPHVLIMMHNFAAHPFLAKLVDDMDAKTLTFKVGNQIYPDVAPTIITGRRNTWFSEGAVATILLPWELYLQYGDRRLLERHYPFMQSTMRYFAAIAPTGVLYSWIGDWHDALPDINSVYLRAEVAARPGNLPAEVAAHFGRGQAGGFPINTPPTIVSTAFFDEAALTMAVVSRLLNKPQEAEEYEQLARHIKARFIATFYKSDEASFGSQTANAFALSEGMIPPGSEQEVMESLAHDIVVTHRGHFSTGELGTDRLLHVLSDQGRADLAYTLMTQNDFPSFALMLNYGSTTTWETWGEAILNQTPLGEKTPIEAGRPLSHIQFVAVDAWFLQNVAGIRRDDSQPGFKAVVLKPELFRQIAWARARYHSVRGWIESDYAVRDGRIAMNVTIPPNTTAAVYVPTANPGTVTESGHPVKNADGVSYLRTENDYAVFAVQSGSYRFSAALDH